MAKQAIAAGMELVETDKGFTLSVDMAKAVGMLTVKGNRSVSSGGFKPIVVDGRIWQLSVNLWATALADEIASLVKKPVKVAKK